MGPERKSLNGLVPIWLVSVGGRGGCLDRDVDFPLATAAAEKARGDEG